MTRRGISVEDAKRIREAKGIEPTKLQRIRTEKGYSQKQLSVVSGVSLRAIQTYEQQTRPIDKACLDSLCSLCIALDCSIEDIIEDENLIEKYKLTK